MKFRSLTFFLLIATLNSCGPKELTDEEKAQIHLEKSDSLYLAEKFNAAKMQIDTINNIYIKQIAIRKKANTLLYNIDLIEHKKNLIYADSVIVLKKKELDSIAKEFRFEKEEKYQDIGNYIYKTQRTEYNPSGTYIKAYVDEKGFFYLSSHYCNEYPLKHNSARFTIGDVFAETEVVTEDGFNHSFVDDNKTYEKVIYQSNSNKDIGSLIQQNTGKRIVVSLQGNKRKHRLTLTTNEKKAISEAYNLSIVLTDFKNLERIIEISKKKIILLEENLRLDETKDKSPTEN